MSTAMAEQTALVPAVEYPIDEQAIASIAQKYSGLSCETRERYDEVRVAIGELVTLRTSVEKRRKSLKSGALEYGRRVDAVAKKLTSLLEAIEDPLREMKAAVDETEEQARRAEEDRIRAEQAAAAKAAQEAEDRRLADERAKLAAETAAFEARRKAADEERAAREEAERIERERVAAIQREQQAVIDAAKKEIEERERKIREDQERAARAEAERQAAIQAEREASERAQRDRVAAAEAEAAEVARAAAEQARLEALRPDVDRVLAFAAELRELAGRAPVVESDEARTAVAWVCSRLETIAGQVETRFASAVAT